MLKLLLLTLPLAVSQPSAPRPRWQVEVTTHGGLSGRGAGAVQVRSSGEAELVTTGGQRCRVRLERQELRRLEEAVRRAAPSRWHPRYYLPDNPTGCCDQVATTMALSRLESGGRGERHAVTGWYDESRSRAPRDALALHDAALEILLGRPACGS